MKTLQQLLQEATVREQAAVQEFKLLDDAFTRDRSKLKPEQVPLRGIEVAQAGVRMQLAQKQRATLFNLAGGLPQFQNN